MLKPSKRAFTITGEHDVILGLDKEHIFFHAHEKNHVTVEPRFNEVPRDQGNWFVISRFFSIHFKRPGWRISFFIPRASLYHRGLLNRGSTVKVKSYF